MTDHIVLLYSDDPKVRDHMRLAIGSRPAADLSVRYLEASSYGEAIRAIDNNDIDLLFLDGEAQPAGGIGIARQIHDEVDEAPPMLLMIARAADRWLAAFAKVDATLQHPLDPVLATQTVADLLRRRDAALPTTR